MEMKKRFVHLVAASVFLGSLSHAQDSQTKIVDQSPKGIKEAENRLVENIRKLIDAKKMMSRDDAMSMLKKPAGGVIELPKAKTGTLSKEEVATLARHANLSVGYCYLCPNCDNWHLNVAGGYAVAKDVVATCDHVVNNDTKMREGYLFVADHEGRVYSVTSIIAASKVMDVALLKVEGEPLKASPLNGKVRQGSAAFCYSSPLKEAGYFSEGIVNRFYWDRDYDGGAMNSLMSARHLRVNFSTDWAPGSSGSAVFDQAGNVIGHVSRIEVKGARANQPMITLHHGTPASAIQLLAESANKKDLLAEIAAAENKEAAKPEDSKKRDQPDSKKTDTPKDKEGE